MVLTQMSMSMSIYTAHKSESSNALYALVHRKQQFSNVVSMYIGRQQKCTTASIYLIWMDGGMKEVC